jgi:hypothetical protein
VPLLSVLARTVSGPECDAWPRHTENEATIITFDFVAPEAAAMPPVSRLMRQRKTNVIDTVVYSEGGDMGMYKLGISPMALEAIINPRCDIAYCAAMYLFDAGYPSRCGFYRRLCLQCPFRGRQHLPIIWQSEYDP